MQSLTNSIRNLASNLVLNSLAALEPHLVNTAKEMEGAYYYSWRNLVEKSVAVIKVSHDWNEFTDALVNNFVPSLAPAHNVDAVSPHAHQDAIPYASNSEEEEKVGGWFEIPFEGDFPVQIDFFPDQGPVSAAAAVEGRRIKYGLGDEVY